MAVSVESLPTHVPEEVLRARRQRRLLGFAVFAVLAVVAIVLAHDVPSWLDLHIQKWAQDRYKWTIVNRQSSPIFRYFFNPIADGLTWAVEHTESLLLALRWPGVVALTGAIGWRTGGLRAGLAGAAHCDVGVGVMPTGTTRCARSRYSRGGGHRTGAGRALGILAARSHRADRVIRVQHDTAQVMPILVYISPVQIIFGLQFAPAVVVTVIYALPPAVRLTNLGLRQVPVVANEVGQSFGATSRQQLFKVQLPIARRTILLGLNQVIMMAFAIVVLASLLGTGDLGQDVLAALQKQEVGVAFASGLVIVLIAVALDRVSTGDRNAVPSQLSRQLPKVPPIATALAVGVPSCGARRVSSMPHSSPAASSTTSPAIDDAGWVQDNLRKDVPIIGGTQAISDFLVGNIIDPLYEWLIGLPWLLVVVFVAFVGWLSRGWRLAATVAACLVLIGAMGSIPGGTGTISMWDLAMNTLSLVLVAITISVLIALPLGMWAGRSDRVERVLRPFLDIAQVMPQFVYLIPVVFLFGIGRSARCGRRCGLRRAALHSAHCAGNARGAPGASRGRHLVRGHRPPGDAPGAVATGTQGHPARHQPDADDGAGDRDHRGTRRRRRTGPRCLRGHAEGQPQVRPGSGRRLEYRVARHHARPAHASVGYPLGG
jgi:glycine betaine/proline transport system permease protein